MTNFPANPIVIEAARWLADQKEPPALAVPALKERFGLRAAEACDAILIARGIRSALRQKSEKGRAHV